MFYSKAVSNYLADVPKQLDIDSIIGRLTSVRGSKVAHYVSLPENEIKGFFFGFEIYKNFILRFNMCF
jgi:hypothetical protein